MSPASSSSSPTSSHLTCSGPGSPTTLVWSLDTWSWPWSPGPVSAPGRWCSATPASSSSTSLRSSVSSTSAGRTSLNLTLRVSIRTSSYPSVLQGSKLVVIIDLMLRDYHQEWVFSSSQLVSGSSDQSWSRRMLCSGGTVEIWSSWSAVVRTSFSTQQSFISSWCGARTVPGFSRVWVQLINQSECSVPGNQPIRGMKESIKYFLLLSSRWPYVLQFHQSTYLGWELIWSIYLLNIRNLDSSCHHSYQGKYLFFRKLNYIKFVRDVVCKVISVAKKMEKKIGNVLDIRLAPFIARWNKRIFFNEIYVLNFFRNLGNKNGVISDFQKTNIFATTLTSTSDNWKRPDGRKITLTRDQSRRFVDKNWKWNWFVNKNE